MRKRCVLVVDDDPEIRETLDEYLSNRDLEVLLAADGTEMKAHLEHHTVDLVMLDLNLPGDDGIALTRYLRGEGKMGIIIITGVGDPEDRVLGLETGADDYVVKPFNLRELLARVHSVLRRFDMSNSTEQIQTSEQFSGWSISASNGRLVHKDGSSVVVSVGEIDLLRVLLKHPDKPVSRDELLSLSSHREIDLYDRTIDVRIARLRQKIEQDPAHPQIIRTVRNVGYMLVS